MGNKEVDSSLFKKNKSKFKIQNCSWKITTSLQFQFSHSKNKNNNLAVGSENSPYEARSQKSTSESHVLEMQQHKVNRS